MKRKLEKLDELEKELEELDYNTSVFGITKDDIRLMHSDLKEKTIKLEKELNSPEYQLKRLKNQLRPLFNMYIVYEKLIPFQIVFTDILTLDVIQYIQRLFCENMCQINKALLHDFDDKCECEGDNLEIDHKSDIYVVCTKCNIKTNSHTTYHGIKTSYKDVCMKCLVKFPDYNESDYNKDYERCIIS